MGLALIYNQKKPTELESQPEFLVSKITGQNL
jgi:hypothetical protein